MSIGSWKEGELARWLERKLEEKGLINIRALVGTLDIGQVSGVRFGSSTLTYPGGAPTVTLTVSHGLAAAPTTIVATPDNSATGKLTNASVGNITPTTFDITGHTIDGSNPAAATTVAVYWVAT